MTGLILNAILFLFALTLLSIGSWQDIQTREVNDLIWIIMIIGGILIHLLEYISRVLANNAPTEYLLTYILNIIFSVSLALFLTLSGLGGEADRIAFFSIGFISPICPPFVFFKDPIYEQLIIIVPRILGTFFNAYLIVFPVPFLLFGYNIFNQRSHPDFYVLPNESIWTRLLIRFIGYPHTTQRLNEELNEKTWHYDFLEEFKEEKGWYIAFRVRLDTPEADLTRKQELISQIQAQDKCSIWIQPSLPFIFVLTLGYLVDILFGNTVLLLMYSLL